MDSGTRDIEKRGMRGEKETKCKVDDRSKEGSNKERRGNEMKRMERRGEEKGR